jgi:hypothetical protein
MTTPNTPEKILVPARSSGQGLQGRIVVSVGSETTGARVTEIHVSITSDTGASQSHSRVKVGDTIALGDHIARPQITYRALLFSLDDDGATFLLSSSVW